MGSTRGAAVRIALAAAGLSAVALLGACATPGEAPTAASTASPTASVTPLPGDGTVRIGAVLTATEPTAQAFVSGLELAARELNDQGGLLGAPVLVVYRNAADPAAASAAITELGPPAPDSFAVPSALFPPAPASSEPTPGASSMTGAPVLGADGVAGVAILGYGEPGDEAFAARLRTANPGLGDPLGGAAGYDYAIAVALAVVAAGGDSPTLVAQQLPKVLSGGFPCTSYGECAAALADGQSVAYRGVSGALRVDGAWVAIGS